MTGPNQAVSARARRQTRVSRRSRQRILPSEHSGSWFKAGFLKFLDEFLRSRCILINNNNDCSEMIINTSGIDFCFYSSMMKKLKILLVYRCPKIRVTRDTQSYETRAIEKFVITGATY